MSILGSLSKRLGFSGEDAHVDRSEAGIRDWMVQRLAKAINVEPAAVVTSKRFDEYGLDSRLAIAVSGELEKIVERRLSPALLFEFPTIDQVAHALAQQLDEAPDA